MVYRKDTSFSHVSNAGELVIRRSFDSGKTWSEGESLYNSIYDDRNIVVGELPNGNIIVIFRRFDHDNSITIDSGYIIGDSFGGNWSKYTAIEQTRGILNQPFGKIFLYKDKFPGFLIQIGSSKTLLFYSENNFLTSPSSKLVMQDVSKKLFEPNLINLGNGKSLILYRNGDNTEGAASYIQYVSNDWENFNYMGGTNMFDDYCCSVSSPVSIRLSKDKKYIEVTGNSRRLFQSEENLKNEIRVYRTNTDEILLTAKAYSLFQIIERPWPSKHWLYGYPDFIEIDSKGRSIYIFTEGKIYDETKIPINHLNNEDAQLFMYYF